ncbi:MAG: hypothetical protein AB9888_15110 [Bacteroidales bacterium]
MKTLMSLLSVLASVSMLAGCEEPIPRPEKTTESIIAEVPLNAYFSTEFHKNIIADGHIDLPGPVSQLVQTGTGTDSEIGLFNISLSCCWSVSCQLKGRSGGTLRDYAGNELYIKCKENLAVGDMTDKYPADKQVICGRYEFAGGTGRFEGASGAGTINCTVTNNGNTAVMSHHWQGTLKIRKSYITDRPDY